MIAIVDYEAGNLRSVERACRAVGVEARITADPEAVASAGRVIFPGVGAAPSAMRTLRARGMDEALREALGKGTPILGICLGAQILLDRSEEGPTETLGFIPGETRRFVLPDPALKIPHMGWNAVEVQRPHPLLDGLPEATPLYFVHSYYLAPFEDAHVYGVSDYGGPFCVAVGRENLLGLQFHPEKSGRLGMTILERFARWDGTLPDA